MERILRGEIPERLGVAVSGGGDSSALMHLAARWAQGWAQGRAAIHVVTVDHGLREGTASEAEAVGRGAAALGLPHAVLRWRWDGTGNLQARARDGRRAAIDGWARAGGLRAVLLGHTMDDQAETLAMRLARGSGVEGLSAMEEGALAPARSAEAGTPLLRPLLGVAREALRGWLRAQGIEWIDDPSNADERFERVRARRAIEALGLDPARLAATAARMARARRALELRAFEIARGLTRPAPRGDVRLDREGLARADEDTRLRILAGALRCVSGAAYRPREADLERALAAALAGGARTLHGCAVRPVGRDLLIHREAAAVAGLASPVGQAWDGAWHLRGPAIEGCEVRALGEAGLAAVGPLARGRGPRSALAAKPAAWRGGDLAGFAPLGLGAPHAADWRPPGGAFPRCLLTRAEPPGRDTSAHPPAGPDASH